MKEYNVNFEIKINIDKSFVGKDDAQILSMSSEFKNILVNNFEEILNDSELLFNIDTKTNFSEIK